MNGLRFESPFHDIMGTDDTAGSIAKFRARLCLQTLAFMDKAYFRDICGGAQLTSVFDELDPTHRLNANYDQLYKSFTSEDRSTRARLSWWRSDRGANANTNKVGANACAWRDYNRRNIVFWLTKSLRAEEERSL